jgi:hypothetical protein
MESMTSDVYQKRREECEAKKLELRESLWSITCKCGSSQLTLAEVPDSIAEIPPIKFENMSIRGMG